MVIADFGLGIALLRVQPAVPPPPPVSRAGGRQNRPVPQPPAPPQLPIPTVTETVYEISEVSHHCHRLFLLDTYCCLLFII